MTPAARVAASIEILDRFLAGVAVEKALTGWARRARYAGSGDRAAVRDHVFDAVRRLRSDGTLGGAGTGRGLMLGALRRQGVDPETIFTGASYAPDQLSDEERQAGGPPADGPERFDIPDWLWPQFTADLGSAAEPVARALQARAPVHLRVNLIRTDRQNAIDALSRDGVIAEPHPVAETALQVSEGSRRIRHSDAYRSGLVELQAAAGQAVVAGLPLQDGMRVLDYCAGGGGKALAMAACARIDLFVHDIAPGRMRDLPDRAARADVTLTQLAPDDVVRAAPFDLVLCDVPCSGSGAWRRSPEGKWALTDDRLDSLVKTQGEILSAAAGLSAETGVLAYATCSLLEVENAGQVRAFLRQHPNWQMPWQHTWAAESGTDGFYSAHLTREG